MIPITILQVDELANVLNGQGVSEIHSRLAARASTKKCIVQQRLGWSYPISDQERPEAIHAGESSSGIEDFS